MSAFNEDLFFLIASPIYAVIIITEIIVSNIYHKGWYTKKGTFENLWIMTSALLLDILMRFVGLVAMNYFFDFRFIEIENVVLYWVLLILFEDFVFWFLHWVDHYVRFFWAVHITHHNSEEYNLTVGLRSSVLEPLYRFLYFIPIVLLGFQPIDILVVFSLTQWYGILVHTQAVPKLGPLEWIFVTPSHHRVHHGSNTQYLDKNMGMFLIIWDRIFGTFEKENETVKYGITQNINSHDPRKVVFHEFANILQDVKNAPGFYNKWMYIIGPPGWSHDGSKMTSRQLRNEQSKAK